MPKVKHYDFQAEAERQDEINTQRIRQAEQRSFEQRVMRTLEKQDAEIFALRAEVNRLHRDMFKQGETLQRLIGEGNAD